MKNVLKQLQDSVRQKSVVIKDLSDDNSFLNQMYSITTEWLNPVNDEISVLLIKKNKQSPWTLLDDGWCNEECNNLLTYADNPRARKIMHESFVHNPHQFKGSVVKHNQAGYYLNFKHLSDFDDCLHQFVQFIVDTYANAHLVSVMQKVHYGQEHCK